MITIEGDIDAKLREGKRQEEAYLIAHGISVPVPDGTVRRRAAATSLPQPSRQLLARVSAHQQAREAYDRQGALLAQELAELAGQLSEDHGVQVSEIAALTGVSRKAVYAALERHR